jgi:stearoyl-CoA desaturase (delta-9 desaturase)
MSDAVDMPPIAAPSIDRKSKTMPCNPYLRKLQRRHFLWFDVLPFVGTLGALALALVRPPTTVDLMLFLSLWLVTGLGLTVGYHRLFSHRAFDTSPWMASLLLVMGSMAARGPMVSWVAMHRRHHECADHDGDMHSPVAAGDTLRERLRAWAHSHLTWMVAHDYPDTAHYVPDLIRNRDLMRQNRRYYAWVALGLVLPAAIGGLIMQSFIGALTGFLWGGVVRMFVVEQSMSAVNSFLHLFGSRPFDVTDDNSRNSAAVSLFTWGEGWHNNHHAFPNSASFGLTWYRYDIGYWFIGLLRRLGLVWNVRVPTDDKIARRNSVGSTLGPLSASAIQQEGGH